MLNLFNKFTVPGVERVEIYHDDEDERRFYMLVGKPSLSLGPDKKPMISLIAFARDLSLMAAVSDKLPTGETEGGLMSMQLEMSVSEEDQKTIRDYICAEILGGQRPALYPMVDDGVISYRRYEAVPGREPVLAYPTWVDGKVRLSLMPAAGPTFIKATEGSDKPSLTGANVASFNVMLGQEGVRLLRESLNKGVVAGTLNYELSFMARIPNIHISVSGNWKDVHEEAKTHSTIEDRVGDRVVRRYPAVNSLSEMKTKFAKVKIEYDKTNFPVMPGQDQSAVDQSTKAMETLVLQIANGYIAGQLSTPAFTADITAKLGTDPMQNFKPPGTVAAGANQLWLKDWRQEMDGQFEFTLDGRIAQPVATNPNGLLYEIISPDEFAKHIVEADLNTPIFHVLEVPVRVTADFANDPIAAIMVTVEYEQKDERTGDVKSKVETFTYTTGDEVFYFRTTMAKHADGSPKDGYTYTSKINYKASSAPVTTPPVTTSERSLLIGYDGLSCVRVQCIAGAIPWDEIERVVVDLRYPGSMLPTGTQQVTLEATRTEASWFTYTGGNPSREYEYELTFHTKEGPKLTQPAQKAVSDRLVVNAPFGDQLDVTFVPQGTFPPIASIVLSVRYADEVSGYRVDDVHVFTSNVEVWPWKVRLPDASKRSFDYKVDITYADGAASQGQWTPGAEGTLLVGEVTSQMLEVEVVAGALDMTKWKLVVLRLAYTDPASGQVQDETFQITPANATGEMKWKVALKDPGARGYSYHLQAFGSDGVSKHEVPPTRREDTLLVLEI